MEQESNKQVVSLLRFAAYHCQPSITLQLRVSPALAGLLAVPLAGQAIGGADRLRAEHAFPPRIAGALEAHVTAESENRGMELLFVDRRSRGEQTGRSVSRYTGN